MEARTVAVKMMNEEGGDQVVQSLSVRLRAAPPLLLLQLFSLFKSDGPVCSGTDSKQDHSQWVNGASLRLSPLTGEDLEDADVR